MKTIMCDDYYWSSNVHVIKNHSESRRAPKELYSSFSLYIYVQFIPPISRSFLDEISQSAADLAEDFQERRGVNVKTNDSGCKEEKESERGGEGRGGRELGGRKIEGEKISAMRRGYKGGCSHSDDDNSFLFLSLVSGRSGSADPFYFSSSSAATSSSPSSSISPPRP